MATPSLPFVIGLCASCGRREVPQGVYMMLVRRLLLHMTACTVGRRRRISAIVKFFYGYGRLDRVA